MHGGTYGQACPDGDQPGDPSRDTGCFSRMQSPDLRLDLDKISVWYKYIARIGECIIVTSCDMVMDDGRTD